MPNKSIKLVSSVLSLALVSTMVFSPAVHAEGRSGAASAQAELKKQVWEQRLQEAIRDHASEMKQAASTSSNDSGTVRAMDVATVDYQNQLDVYASHEYFFSVSNGGTLEVKDLAPSEWLDYEIYDAYTGEPVEGNQLAAGDYVFAVYSMSDTPVSYHYQLSGVTFSNAPTQLPSLSITNPSGHETRLAKGTTSYTFKGSTDADSLDVYPNDENPVSLTAPGAFSYNMSLRGGWNSADFYAMDTNTGNAVLSHYDLIVPSLKRLAGADRYEVSANISKELEQIGLYPDTIVIARGDLFTDALSGGPLAAQEAAPILLTATSSLPSSIKSEVQRLHPRRAIILGGTGSVSTNVESQLKSLGVSEIERIAGSDRFAVSAAVAAKVVSPSQDTAIVASGLNFPDALSSSSLAGQMGMPILLVGQDKVPASIASFIQNHPSIKHFIIVGGPATVSDNVKNELSKYGTVERISGANRYQVAINVAKYGMDHYGMDLSTMVFARGDVFADALSGGPLAVFTGAPIMLTTSTKLESNVDAFLSEHRGETDQMYILGGYGSVSSTTEQQLSNYLN
ncbi:cell wall-binding repeat-containing protein [Polycladomyces subterraneus]|uniref:Cell wall-binding repeat-containing protein n=1 Tax=Polycladomyces subterraneus TaxID=1016997 RepID=A0ABT8ILG5_9BACL|nr:cell wall-binding repeat-containing protein [Polycladomyces subterraneus]MDN4593631.1 cell wall-binding repeat-containing protein [Polycladomyces subterraneus]